MNVVMVIPTYNEKGNIEKLLDGLSSVVSKISDKYNFQFLVVDDSSPDGTAEMVRKYAKGDKRVALLLNKKKMGLGGAYLVGMKFACQKLGADVLFQIDADLSHDPKLVPEFLAKLTAGNDMVLGSRYIGGGAIPKNWGLNRKFLSIVGNWIIRIVIGRLYIHDWTTGYRAIKREVYESVKGELDNERFFGYAFQIGFLHKALAKGYRVGEVPLVFVDRVLGKSKLGSEYLKNTLMYILKARILEILRMRFVKFAVVGGIGALVQLTSLQLYRSLVTFQLAFFLSIESAVVSNFILNNLWTYKDKRLSMAKVPVKFVQFNLASGGSILIQQAIGFMGEKFIGLRDLFILPIVGIGVDTGMLFAVVGILVGMFWNFFAYNRFIWKVKK